MGKINPLVDLDPSPAPPPQRGAGEIAEAVNRKAGGFLKPGDQDSGCEVCEMVFDVMDLRFELNPVSLLERFRGG